MKKMDEEISESLLQINAIKLSPSTPFTWASGWRSPIYCDNRKILSFPAIRRKVITAFVALAKEHYSDAEVVAGVATGAIAFGVLVAEELNLPFLYVRSAPKGHGLGNQVEGVFTPGQKVLVIEDLVSTGQSSLQAVEALRNAGAKVIGMLAIFSYEFDLARENFRNSDCRLITLSNYQSLVSLAIRSGLIDSSHEGTLARWRENPSSWTQK